MYTIAWVNSFVEFTKENPIDLQKFALFYEKYMANRHFEYLTENSNIPVFTIESMGNQLPHLMGLQHWNNLPTKQASIQYDYMKNGEWNLSFLQKADEGAWQTYRERIEFTPHLYNLLYSFDCTVKLIHPVMPSPFKNRRIDMVFQKERGKFVFVLELRETEIAGIYRPVSLTTHRKNDRSLHGKHLRIKITSVNVRTI